jgi:hypothetical protein
VSQEDFNEESSIKSSTYESITVSIGDIWIFDNNHYKIVLDIVAKHGMALAVIENVNHPFNYNGIVVAVTDDLIEAIVEGKAKHSTKEANYIHRKVKDVHRPSETIEKIREVIKDSLDGPTRSES